jgi:hypothetical protein
MRNVIYNSHESALYDEAEQYKKRWNNEMKRWCK